jgi:glutamate racemase
VRQLATFLAGYLTPENLQEAVNKNLDLFTLVCNHYDLLNPQILPLFKSAMRLYWDLFEEATTDVPRLYKVLRKKFGNHPVLLSPQTINYLNNESERLYKKMYQLVWQS